MMSSLLLLLLLLPSSVGAIECNNLRRFRCNRGGENVRPTKGPGNGCTWKRDAFKKYRRFPIKKPKLFGICVNAGQSESEFFGTPAERCDCGTKCMRKCKSKRGYKKKCFWASRDGSPKGLAGTCLPNRHFAEGGSGPSPLSCSEAVKLNDTTLTATISAWIADEADETAATTNFGDISCWNTSEVTDMQ